MEENKEDASSSPENDPNSNRSGTSFRDGFLRNRDASNEVARVFSEEEAYKNMLEDIKRRNEIHAKKKKADKAAGKVTFV